MIIIENLGMVSGCHMPNYDFICADCHKNFSKSISYADFGRKPVLCPQCSSAHVQRRISRVRLARSNGTRMQQFSELADPQHLDEMEQNPQELGRHMRRLSEEIGEDVGPQFNDVVERLENGQSTGEIENSMPDYTQSADEQGDIA